MEEVFRSLRQQRRRPDIQSFADALFGGRPGFAPTRQERALESPPAASKGPVPEQQKTLESLKRFTQEMAEKQGEAKLKFPGGEIKSKPSEENQFYELERPSPQAGDDLILKDLDLNRQVKAIFLGEKDSDEQAAMLGRMISAMRLSNEEVLRIPLSEELDIEDADVFQHQLEGLAQAIFLTAPQVIIPLGGKAVGLLFGKKRRLSQVRGKFYSLDLKFQDEKTAQTQMMPIFHPEYLLANPGMKRTAWEDLQKIMQYLGL